MDQGQVEVQVKTFAYMFRKGKIINSAQECYGAVIGEKGVGESEVKMGVVPGDLLKP